MELLPVVTEEDLSHPDFRAVVAALKSHPEAEPATLLSLLQGEILQGLVAGLLLDEPSSAPDIAAWRRRIELLRGKQESRVAHQALAAAQSQGQADLSDLVREHIVRARKVRDLVVGGEAPAS